jgi:predicted DNA-binding transcriptional regulator AlpA
MSVEAPEKIAPALLTISQVCQLLNVCRAEFYRLDSTGKFAPLPVALCKKRLYLRSEVENWLKAKCPHRRIWESQKKEAHL